MPNLMPGVPGTKEAFGISVIKKNLTLTIPPKAISHYNILHQDSVVLITGHRGKSGFGLLKKDTAFKSVFNKYIQQMQNYSQIYLFNNKAYVLLYISKGTIKLNEEILNAFFLHVGHKLIAVKSTTVTVSFTPIEIWEDNFRKHGFLKAIENMHKLKEY